MSAPLHSLLPGNSRMERTLRMPYPQNAHGAATRNFLASLQHFDALRRVKTTAGQSRKAIGPLAELQRFIEQPSGGVNTPGSMQHGSHKMNSRRLVAKTPGRTAGIG